MAKVLLVVFSALLSSSMALWPQYLPWKYGRCLSVGMQKDFQPEKFFVGKWYEISSFGNYLIQGDGICTTMESKIQHDKLNTLFYHYEPLLQKYVYLRGTTQLNEMKGTNFMVEFDFLAGLTNIKLPMTVVDTDYDSYAILYSCEEAFGFKAEMAWVAVRQRGGAKNNDGIINSALNKAGINPQDLIPQSSTGCSGLNEPHL